MRIAFWAALAAASAWAASLAVVHATPVDEALPYLAAIVTLVAAATYPSLMIAVPLLMVVEIAVFEEPVRLLLFGAVVAGLFGAALAALRPARLGEAGPAAAVVAAGALFILRWIPLEEVLLVRELVLVAIALAVVKILGGTPFAVAVGVLAAFVTPAIPLRTFVLPLLVLAASLVAAIAGATRLRLLWPSAIAIGVVMLFFAWSGVAARSLPYLLAPAAEHTAQSIIAIPPGESLTLEVPREAGTVVLSGANVADLPRGTAIGTIDPGGVPVRIGDVSDWGAMRREHVHRSRNGVPRDPAGRLRGYGYNAWVDGAGRVRLPPHGGVIRLTTAADLPPGASLQFEGFERRGR